MLIYVFVVGKMNLIIQVTERLIQWDFDENSISLDPCLIAYFKFNSCLDASLSCLQPHKFWFCIHLFQNFLFLSVFGCFFLLKTIITKVFFYVCLGFSSNFKLLHSSFLVHMIQKWKIRQKFIKSLPSTTKSHK